MGAKQSVVYACDQCGTKVEIDGGMMGGSVPAGWLQLAIGGSSAPALVFHAWDCVEKYGAARVAAGAAT